MTFLALDTAMAACSAAILDGTTLRAGQWQAMERGHAEALPPMVDAVMREAGSAYAGLERIVVTIGPGSFTGLRIGLSLARGLGLALGIPVIGIDSLRAIAANATNRGSPLLVAADARRDEVYAALYGSDGTVFIPPCLLPAADLVARLPAGAMSVIGTGGDAIIAISERGDLVRSTAGDLPDARNFGFGAALPAVGRMPEPLYIRGPDAKPQAPPAGRPLQVGFSPAAPALLAALHAECFDHPWTEDAFARLLESPGMAAMLAANGDAPLGFILARTAADEAEIITVGVRPAARRHGVARSLLEHQFTELMRQGARACFIEVAADNAAARALYERTGFRQAGLRRGYYERRDGSREDALVMRRDLLP